jgi:hypothetical protein
MFRLLVKAAFAAAVAGRFLIGCSLSVAGLGTSYATALRMRLKFETFAAAACMFDHRTTL